jgi:hypothetical protein
MPDWAQLVRRAKRTVLAIGRHTFRRSNERRLLGTEADQALRSPECTFASFPVLLS